MKQILWLCLAACLASPALAKPIEPLPPQYQLQAGILESLPYPVLVAHYLPEGFLLLDARVQHWPHARLGQQASYALVYASHQGSFAIQSRLASHSQFRRSCPQTVHFTSEAFWFQGLSFEPQVVELVSPACAVTGQSLQTEGLSSEQSQQIWNQLKWFYPLPFRP